MGILFGKNGRVINSFGAQGLDKDKVRRKKTAFSGHIRKTTDLPPTFADIRSIKINVYIFLLANSLGLPKR